MPSRFVGVPAGITLCWIVLASSAYGAQCPGNGSALPGKDRAVVVKRTEQAVLVRGKRTGRYFGCAQRLGKVVKLQHVSGAAAVHQPQFAGDFVGAIWSQATSEEDVYTIETFSLRTGKSKIGVYFGLDHRPSKLVLNHRGTAAWVSDKDLDYKHSSLTSNVFFSADNQFVHSQGVGQRRPRLLDFGPDINPTKLTLDVNGRKVLWERAGAEVSASIDGKAPSAWSNKTEGSAPIFTLAGTPGDVRPGRGGLFNGPYGLSVAPDGSLLVSDNTDVTRVDILKGSGVRVAGVGSRGALGEGGPAVKAAFYEITGVAATADGGFVTTDLDSGRVRRVNPAGILTTVAILPTKPLGVAVRRDGSLLLVDTSNNQIKLLTQSGAVTVVAGQAQAGFSGDGGPAIQAQLNHPTRVVALSDDSFLIADTFNNRVRRVAPDGTITTVAGSGEAGLGRGSFEGDGGPATQARLNGPTGIAPLPGGGFLIADALNLRVRHVDAAGNIVTVAGGAKQGSDTGFRGDGGPATEAHFGLPVDVAVAPNGDYLVADSTNDVVRVVDVSRKVKLEPGKASWKSNRKSLRSSAFTVTVTGRQIRRVTLSMDEGKTDAGVFGRRTFTNVPVSPNNSRQRFDLWVRKDWGIYRADTLRRGRHTLTARVEFARESGTKDKILRLSFRKR